MSGHTTSTRTLVVALAANLGIAASKFVAACDHRLVGDADRRRAQRRRFDQPAAFDVGPPAGQAAARQAPSVRLWPRALFLELRRRGAGLLARRRSVGLRRHHPHRQPGAGGVADHRLCGLASLRSCSKAGRRSRRSRIQEGQGEARLVQAIRRSKDPPAFIVLLENGAAIAGIIAAAIGLLLSQLTAQSVLRRRGVGRDRSDPRSHRAGAGV